MRLDELYQLGRRLQEHAQGAMSRDSAPGVSPAEVVVIRDLLSRSPSTISEIASRTGFAHSRVSTAVASLRDRGWVVTSVDETDRRRTIASVTERVRQGAAATKARRAQPVLSALLRDVPAERRAELIAALDEVHRALNERRTDVGDPARLRA
jgi:MarR family 2-MHQ and catechol resistance regulon transcriptional repressor